jgi:hypothetical protein
MSMPKWAKADPDIAKTTANANTVTSLVFIFSSSFPLWVFAAKQKKATSPRRLLGARSSWLMFFTDLFFKDAAGSGLHCRNSYAESMHMSTANCFGAAPPPAKLS